MSGGDDSDDDDDDRMWAGKGTMAMAMAGRGKSERTKRADASWQPASTSMAALPAQHTKHLNSLHYRFLDNDFHLAQRDDGISNGTALWLGGQLMAAFLSQTFATRRTPRLRAIELGAGIGLTSFVLLYPCILYYTSSAFSLVLSSIGVDVLATDTHHVISSVLRHNAQQNAPSESAGSGSIQVRELDWTVPPSNWSWDNPSVVASSTSNEQVPLPTDGTDLLGPPFDLILSSDTLYSPTLVTPLLRTLRTLSLASQQQQQQRSSTRFPPVYICLERRDPALIDAALAEARSDFGFVVERVPHRKLCKAMEKTGLDWAREEWEGIEIWKLVLRQEQGKVQAVQRESSLGET